jgi:sugar lactone lactonase YvrE
VWPDGIALDAAGAVWVANPFGREVLRVVEGGEVTDRLSTGELACYACALGGPDGRALFLCAAPPFPDEAARSTGRSARLLTWHASVPAA